METVQNEILQVGGWVVRQRLPAKLGHPPVFVMLHGWTGNEDVMWVFASHLPEEAMILAPRGLYPAELGGFSWQSQDSRVFPEVEAFRPAVDALSKLLTPANFPLADWSQLRLVGVSQGAALAYSFAFVHPERIQSLAGLSGFMPEGAASLAVAQPLRGKSAFVTHGARDELVPVERARQAARILQDAGAQVVYCEDDVGHKLSVSCFRGMQTFFESH